MKNKRIVLIIVFCLTLVAGAGIGGTAAYLATKTTSVENTFTYGDINIKLTETDVDKYTFIPGVEITKDPVVTVKKGSEPCYLFVKVTESSDWPDKAKYQIMDEWQALKYEGSVNKQDGDKIYYREVDSSESNQEFQILYGNKITVSNELVKQNDAGTPTLTFTAYAVQKEGMSNVTAAWEATGSSVESEEFE